MKKLIVLFLLIFCANISTLSAQDTQEVDAVLDDLQVKMSTVKSMQTDFIQEKNLALFKQKIVLKGKISIQKPGLLAWRVFSPLRYCLVITPSSISQWDQDSNQVQSVSLAKNPSFQVAIQQMQNWFSGAYKSMQKDYDILILSRKPLKLEFTPRITSLAANFIQNVTMSFQDDLYYLSQINIQEKSGDTTLLKFIDPVLNQEIAALVWEVRS